LYLTFKNLPRFAGAKERGNIMELIPESTLEEMIEELEGTYCFDENYYFEEEND
jgi:hypothetical protein